MRNSFFKYLLLRGGNAASRAELETEILPYTFYTQPKTLKNYRIYGNTENGQSVGDKTANFFNGDWQQGGINSDGYETVNDKRVRSPIFNIVSQKTYTFNSNLYIATVYGFYYDGSTLTREKLLYNNSSGAAPVTIDVPLNVNRIKIALKTVENAVITPSDVKWLMLNEGSTALPYEPYGYKIPVVVNEQTTNIYLDEPLAKSGENADYIEYKTQKRYNVDGTSEDVALPEITVFDDENEISIDTTVQPSKVYIQGKISEIPSVSQSLQSSPQTLNLQPLSLDVMPIDRSEFQINDISEVPVEDENSVEEIPETENFETSGDEENAE